MSRFPGNEIPQFPIISRRGTYDTVAMLLAKPSTVLKIVNWLKAQTYSKRSTLSDQRQKVCLGLEVTRKKLRSIQHTIIRTSGLTVGISAAIRCLSSCLEKSPVYNTYRNNKTKFIYDLFSAWYTNTSKMGFLHRILEVDGWAFFTTLCLFFKNLINIRDVATVGGGGRQSPPQTLGAWYSATISVLEPSTHSARLCNFL